MPWKTSAQQQRLHFLSLAVRPQVNFRALCRKFSISAPTGYKWLARYRRGGTEGLGELSRAPRHSPQKFRSLWLKELITLRRQHPSWGAKKLHVLLRQKHPRARQVPSLRTLGRWLQASALSVPRPPRRRPGPQVPRPALTQPELCNDVWTIDFKGWFRTMDGQRCDPLTIRDLASRYLLSVRIAAEQSEACVRRIMTGVFQTRGLPRVIRVDNGTPFAGTGSRQLSSLSVWWVRLGIRVEFTRRAKPQDNGAHEQMHRVLKAETASPAAANPRAQQRRLDRWRREYNTVRPHGALDGRVPAELYTRSPRTFLTAPTPLYPATWLSRRVRPNGWIKFAGVLRFIGRAFVRQLIGLEPATDQSWNVHLEALLIGTLHRDDGAGSMRAVGFHEPKRRRKKQPQKSSPHRKV
jgi:transposase InsO family protein